MKRAIDFALTAADYASRKKTQTTPQQVLLDRVLNNIERIEALRTATPDDKAKALAIAWDAYAKILKTIDPMEDESWGNAKEIGTAFSPALHIIDDEQLASLIMYGEADDDGRD